MRKMRYAVFTHRVTVHTVPLTKPLAGCIDCSSLCSEHHSAVQILKTRQLELSNATHGLSYRLSDFCEQHRTRNERRSEAPTHRW